jgi:hypothetical protein
MSPLPGLKFIWVRCSHGLRRGLLIGRPSGAENKAFSYLELTLIQSPPTVRPLLLSFCLMSLHLDNQGASLP